MNRTRLGRFVVAMILATGGPALAGTAGGIYDMRALLNEPHPFAGAAAPGTTASPPPPVMTTMPLIAPPPPVMRFTPLPGRAGDDATIEPAAGPAPRIADGMSAPADDTRLPARRGFYTTVGIGFDSPEDLVGHTDIGQSANTEMDDGVLVYSAVGRYFSNNVRAEVELAGRHADYDRTVVGTNQSGGGELSVTTLMVNAYYDVDVGWRLVPYFGAGIGVALLDGSDVVVSGVRVPGRDTTEFGFQGMIGLTYLVTPRFGLGLDARYLGSSDDDASAISIGLNARYDL